ncbi:S-adenosyl-L-methionine-dependent methyltransferase [Talaromyces proteolyticus]|uniref:S-adenosyl-L-methionine-dependent methyltransferase n=1 Tax=Talaromyces proteolyticus TaxID=1131652 RepID=A0AAD4KM69_9EURO|nr:S-adenosyl-L-methionine-dependent methyltransferase [Talaromyces proteolyticus]KAH8695175.1 S-adenosyl-L-methionine-dependent methyltransferase [Talaromyces proteolyticus]
MAHHRLFCEPRAGFVAHSLASRRLAEEPLLADSLWLLGDMLQTAQPYTVKAIEKYNDQEPGHAASSLACGTDKSMYEVMEGDPALAARFARAMTAFAKVTNRPTTAPRMNIARTYAWKNLKGKVVDIGGSRGTDAFILAKSFPHLQFVVQDLPQMIAGAEASVPPELAGRVEFMPYDFFTPQTFEADAYIMKQCFHNWPDHYCVRIVKNQIPALKPGVRLIVIDSLVPEPGTMSILAERMVRSFDMMMLTNTNGREREMADWIKIFEQADSRFKNYPHAAHW